MTFKGSNSIYSMHTIHMVFNNSSSIIVGMNSKKIMRSCRTCAHSQVCEARRTLIRSLTQFNNEFGDMLDVKVIHNEENSCVDLLAISCKYYLPLTPQLKIEELK